MVLPEYDGNQIEVRQVEIDLHNPTRNKDETVILLTNLPPNRADAVKVAEIYRRRWKIETLFQILTQTLRCEVNTLGYPRAALFAFAVSLIAYNAVAIIQAAIRNCHGKREADQLSHYYMALEIAQAQDGMMVLLDESDFQYLADLPIEQFAAEMHDVAKCVDLQKFRKNVRGPKKPVKKKPRNKAKPHIATAKLLAERKKSAC